MMAPDDLARLTAWDKSHAWHPFTQMQDWTAPEHQPLFITHGEGVNAAPVETAASNGSAEDALFTRDDSDIQHGRRHQPKKKPRFELNEEEVKEETKAAL